MSAKRQLDFGEESKVSAASVQDFYSDQKMPKEF